MRTVFATMEVERPDRCHGVEIKAAFEWDSGIGGEGWYLVSLQATESGVPFSLTEGEEREAESFAAEKLDIDKN